MRQRLATAICGTLALGLVTFGVIAWSGTRRAAIEASRLRLALVTRRTADLLINSTASAEAQVVALARDRSIRDVARLTEGTARDSAVARLQRADSLSAPILAFEIWDSTARVLFASSNSLGAVGDTVRRTILASLAPDDSAVTGPFVAQGDSVAYATVSPVGLNGTVTRWVAVWRRLSATEASRRSLTDLIGTHARLALGNATGDLWTDLNSITTPPAGNPGDTLFEGTSTNGERVLGSRVPIAGSPWEVAVEFPFSDILEPTMRLARWFFLGGLALLLVGGIIAAVIARSLTRPIAQLAGATEGIRSGDYTRRAPLDRDDEIGKLAMAFNTMADAIADARVKLQEHAGDLERRSAALSDQSRQTEEANRQLRAAVESAEQARSSLEVALRENARTVAELDSVLSSAPVGFAFHDRSLRYVRVNERLATFLGRPAVDIVGRRPSEIVPGVGHDLEAGLSRALDTERPVLDLELSIPGPLGSDPAREWLATLFPVRTREGELLGVGSVLVDMSAYKGLERQFLQAQRMDAVGRLAGGIAHDFNNILTAVASFTEFAIRALPKEHAAVEDLEQVRQAVNRAAGLIRQLLAFSRQQVMQPVVLNLSDVVRNLVPMIRRLIPESVALHSFLDPDLWLVRADPVQIEQILVNLVVNSRDAMPDGGTLTIATGHATLDESYLQNGHRDAAPGDYAVLSVSDSGVGMDAATKARVFEPFFTTKPSGHGTGLGLATVYGIVKQSGGSIWLYSEPGRGTTVKIFFPRHEHAATAPAVEGEPATAEGRPAVILLVEDDDLVRGAALKALSRRGHRVLEAVDGEAALSIIARETGPIDLVITDLVMPRLGGRELGERLRASGHEAAVLYMSGYTGDAVTQRAMVSEGADFLEKPFTPDQLVARVDEILFHHRPAGAHQG